MSLSMRYGNLDEAEIHVSIIPPSLSLYHSFYSYAHEIESALASIRIVFIFSL